MNSMQFWKSVSKKSGVYIITSNEFKHKPVNKQTMVKIGYAKDFNHRLNSYLLYWPNGIFVYDIFFTSKANKRALEKSIHQYLNSKAKYIVSLHSHTEEWFQLSDEDLTKLINVVKKNKTTRTFTDRPVFPFEKHLRVNSLIEATISAGTDRIKPMQKELKELLDTRAKVPLSTEKKPKKNSTKYKITPKKLMY